MQPLRLLLLHRLRQPNTVALGTTLARKALDAGAAFTVKGVADELSGVGHQRAIEALQRIFDEVDDQ